jgi:hypothetical protein
MRCVLCRQINNHSGANFFSGPLFPPLGFVAAESFGDPRVRKADGRKRRLTFYVRRLPPARSVKAVEPPGKGGPINVRRNPAKGASSRAGALSGFGCNAGVHGHVPCATCEHPFDGFLHNTAHKTTQRSYVQHLSLWGLLPISKPPESCCCVMCAVCLQLRACSPLPLLNTFVRPKRRAVSASIATPLTATLPKV